jgi:hypothetical protein
MVLSLVVLLSQFDSTTRQRDGGHDNNIIGIDVVCQKSLWLWGKYGTASDRLEGIRRILRNFKYPQGHRELSHA